MINAAWHKVHGFKATYWLGLLFTLLLCAFMVLVTLPLHFIGNLVGIAQPMYFLAAIIILYFWLPAVVGVLMLSAHHLTHSAIKARNIFVYHHQLMMAKIFLLTVVFFSVIFLLFLIPSNTVKFIMVFIAMLLLFTWVMSMLLVADQHATFITAIALSFKCLWQRFFVIIGMIILIGILMVISVFTLFIAFIWIGPFINNLIGNFYLSYCKTTLVGSSSIQ